MTELHEALADLARDHGAALFRDADAFRGALDDYLDEGAASMGTINLLTDAVRLGALDGLVSMLDSGASVESAVDTAGRRLSRDRGSADVTGSQWAVAVLGYALGRVPASYATRLRPDALTAEPPVPPMPDHTAPRHVPPPPAPVTSPGFPPPGAPGPGPWQAPAPAKKSRTGLVLGLVAAAVVLIVGLAVGLVALSGGDEDTTADDNGTSEATEASPTTTTSESPVTDNPALTVQGDGYTYQLPSDEWTDITEDLAGGAPTIDTVYALGRNVETARGNVLVETSSAYGETDVSALKEQWKRVLEQSTGATPDDIDDITIGGLPAVGVELEWTNQNNFALRQVAYMTISDGQQYSITASFAQSDEEFEDIFHGILETWTWQS